jgi:hypothetical protein
MAAGKDGYEVMDLQAEKMDIDAEGRITGLF